MKLTLSTCTTWIGWLSFVLVFVSAWYGVLAIFKSGFDNPDYRHAASDVQQVRRGIEQFQARYGEYPPQSTWLEELMPAGRERINTNHCRFVEVMESDPYYHPWVYRHPGVHHPESFDFYSAGEDGISVSGGNDPDDIAYWHGPVHLKYRFDDRFRVSVHAGLSGVFASIGYIVLVRLQMRQNPPA